MFRFLIFFFFSLISILGYGQTLPVIKSNSTTATIRDGNNLRKGYWTILPEAKPDIYYAQRSSTTKKVTFYTDIDSIAFDVKPGGEYDFIILLKGKDSCYTRISTLRKPYVKADGDIRTTNDTIPFELGSDNKIHIRGHINDSESLDFMFDTGADQVVLYKKGAKKVKLNFDGKMENAGFGGTHTRDVSNRNTIQLGNMIWKDEAVMYIDNQADKSDGIIGFNIFEDKVVEIDFDQQLMVIHPQSYDPGEGFVASKIIYDGTLPQIPLRLQTGTQSYTNDFVFDMGAQNSLFLTYPTWVNKEFEKLKVIKTQSGRGVGNGRVSSNLVLLPTLYLAGQELVNVPMALATKNAEGWTAHNLLGMDVIKRFNIVIDYQQHIIYLKSNSLKKKPFLMPNSFPFWGWVAVILCIVGIIVVIVLLKMRHKV